MSQKSAIWNQDSPQQFAMVLSTIDDTQTMQDFLRDVMTEKEITEISARLAAATMLKNGKKYTEIIDATTLSSRTIARISDWMKNGSNGYDKALNIIATHHDHIPPTRAE